MHCLLKVMQIRNENMTNLSDDQGFSQFHEACKTENMEIVNISLKNGASVDEAVNMDAPKYAGFTPLHFAARYRHVKVVEKLLNHRASLLKDAEGMTVLHRLINRNMELIQFLNLHRVAKGEFAEEEDYRVRCYNKKNLLEETETNERIITTILSATDKFVIESIGLLQFYVMHQLKASSINNVNKCIDVNSNFWPGYTPLHFAARFNVEAVKSLIQEGANIEAKDSNGVTPFELCVGRYSLEDIYFIISSQSSWKNIVLSDGKTVLLDLIFAMRNLEDFHGFFAEKDIKNLSIPSNSPLWPGFSILHLAVALSKKGMRFRLANYTSLFDDDFKMEEPHRLRRLTIYSPFIEEELIRRPEELVGACLLSGVDVTAQDCDGSTPIHLAFRRLDLENMYFLIKYCKGDSNPTDKDNLSLLHIACAVEDVNLVKKLVANGADINAAVLPSFQWDPEVQYFHNLRPDKHLHVWPGSRPLHVAVTTQNNEIIKLLMEAGVDFHAKDAYGFTALRRQIVQFPNYSIFDDDLLCKFISENSVVDGLSYLHIAAFQKYPKLLKKLLNCGSNINTAIVARDRTAVVSGHYYYDAVNDRTTQLSYFFKLYEGNTPLQMILERCFNSQDYDIAKTLISHGADVLAKNSKGISPLNEFLRPSSGQGNLLKHYLCVMSDSEEKRLACEMHGMTKLHMACHLSDETLIREYLKKGAYVNARIHNDSEIWPGFTPLHILVTTYSPYFMDKVEQKEHNEEMHRLTRLLLKAGADVMITNANGETPLMMDIYENHIKTRPRHMNMLWKKLKKSAVNLVSNEGISHFHLACIRNEVDLVKTFLKLGVDANQTVDFSSKNYPGYTPLHFAVCRETRLMFHNSAVLEIINLLLKYGADVNATDKRNRTPLHIAGSFRSLGALPYKRMIWAGADPQIVSEIGFKPNCRLFDKRFSKKVLTSSCRYVLNKSFFSTVQSLYRAYCKLRKWSELLQLKNANSK